MDRNSNCRARNELGEAGDRRFVTQDWASFFSAFFDVSLGASDDFIVPSPHMPHLMFEWLLARARQRWPRRSITARPVPGDIGTPYDRTAQDATRYVSFADWICPTHCIEPALCPAIGAPRTWEMGDAVRALADRLRGAGQSVAGPALFVCKHHVFGVGTFAVAAVLAGDRLVAEVGASGERAGILVGTISSCHGAVNLLSLGPA